MKKNYSLIFSLACLIIISCNSTNQTPTQTEVKNNNQLAITKEDSAFLTSWNSFKNNQLTLKGGSSFNKPVDSLLAEECVTAYYTKMKNLKSGWDTVKSNPKLTLSVGFNFSIFQNWLSTITGQPDEIKVRFGIYTENFIKSLDPQHPEKIGRLTVFLWPYKNGVPLPKSKTGGATSDPFNLGDMIP